MCDKNYFTTTKIHINFYTVESLLLLFTQACQWQFSDSQILFIASELCTYVQSKTVKYHCLQLALVQMQKQSKNQAVINRYQLFAQT